MIKDTSEQDELKAPADLNAKKIALGAVAMVFVITAIFLVYPAFSNWLSSEKSIPKDRLKISSVERGSLVRDVTAQGKIVAAIKPTIFSTASGVVTLAVSPGDRVEQNQLLATIDSPELKNLFDQESSALSSAKTQLQRHQIESKTIQLQNQQNTDEMEVNLVAARRELRRAVSAYEKKAISEFDFDKANDDVAIAELRFTHSSQDAKLKIESLQFEMQTLQLNIDRQSLKVNDLQRQIDQLIIHSPVAGIIGNLAIENKDVAANNQALLTVVDLSAFEIELQIPDNYSDALQIGLDTEISHNGKRYGGQLVAISPEVLNSQITTKVRFIDEQPANLKQNQRVSARVLLESRQDVLKIKRGPFLESGGGKFVYVVENNIAQRHAVQLGVASVSDVEVVAGLKEGQSIVISNTRDFEGLERVYLTN